MSSSGAAAWVARHSPTRGAQRLVLLALAGHSDHVGPSFPTRLRLAQHTGLQLGTLERVLQRLEEYQHIDADRSGPGTVLTIVVDVDRVGRPRPPIEAP
jgi:hypothetical protein